VAGFRVSKAAQADIREVGRYTQQQWGKDQRRVYLDGLNDRFQLLANTPMLAAERQTLGLPVRIHPYEKHLILYVIEDGGILIVRVLHQSMDVPAQLSH
jgi:toxin ParE1/3/4